MTHTYTKRFETIFNLINSDKIRPYAQVNNQNSFIRNRKMPLKDIILCTLSKKGLTTTMELHKYFSQKRNFTINISKQGYLKQRKKLNHEVFKFLNYQYLSEFYNSKEPTLWNGYLVFAVDGTKVEVPSSEENRATFGELGNHKNKGPARALLSGILDVFNNFFLNLQIDSIKTSESELAKKNICEAKNLISNRPAIVIFDRGYPSIELINFLQRNKINYLFRLSSNDYKNERQSMRSSDETVKLVHSYSRLQKIKKNHPELVDKIKAQEFTKTRIIASQSPSNKEIALMTNLSFEFKAKDIENLYFKRWEIEKKYHTLKNKMKFESITGKSSLYVYQDFWAQILVYNMIQDVIHTSNENIKIIKSIKEYKHVMRINENMAIGIFKEQFIDILIESSTKTRKLKLIWLRESIEKYLLPVRKLSSRERKYNLSNKYKNNQKNSF